MSASSTTGWSRGVLRATKLYQSVSTSGPRARVKPMARKMDQSSSMTWVTGCRPPLQPMDPGRERSTSVPPCPPTPSRAAFLASRASWTLAFTRLASAPNSGPFLRSQAPQPSKDSRDLPVLPAQVPNANGLQGVGLRGGSHRLQSFGLEGLQCLDQAMCVHSLNSEVPLGAFPRSGDRPLTLAGTS